VRRRAETTRRARLRSRGRALLGVPAGERVHAAKRAPQRREDPLGLRARPARGGIGIARAASPSGPDGGLGQKPHGVGLRQGFGQPLQPPQVLLQARTVPLFEEPLQPRQQIPRPLRSAYLLQLVRPRRLLRLLFGGVGLGCHFRSFLLPWPFHQCQARFLFLVFCGECYNCTSVRHEGRENKYTPDGLAPSGSPDRFPNGDSTGRESTLHQESGPVLVMRDTIPFVSLYLV
jgi:hypothetical protein